MSGTSENNNGAAAVMELPVAEVRPAAANVHGKEKKCDPNFRGLVESIKANGIIHRIVVRKDPKDGGWVVVDGHRRLAAAQAAGLKSVPVEVRDVDADKALAVTIAANVQRLGNDPLLEAEAIERMLASGMERREIAASIGKDESYVARRARLISLAKPWREFARRVPCTTDLLERVAAHDKALQERVADKVGLDESEYECDTDERVTWSEFASTFSRETMKLADARFDTEDCRSCPHNTACHAYLFDFMRSDEDKGDQARCQDAACFTKRNNDRVDAIVEDLRRRGTPAVEVADKWRIPQYWDAVNAKDRRHTQAYVYAEGGLKVIAWSVPRVKPAAAGGGMTAEEKEAERRRKRSAKLVKSARGKVRSMLSPGEDGRVAFFSASDAAAAAYNAIALKRLERDLSHGWINDGLVDDVMAELPGEATAAAGLSEDESKAYADELEERRRADERLAAYAADADDDDEADSGEGEDGED